MVGIGKQIINSGPDHPKMKEFIKKCPGKAPEKGIFIQLSETDLTSRTYKTHIPLSLLPNNLINTAKVRIKKQSNSVR